jgi:hypothetical protein
MVPLMLSVGHVRRLPFHGLGADTALAASGVNALFPFLNLLFNHT